MRQGECKRHFKDPRPDDPFYVVRCAHLDNRFVVEIAARNWEGGFVDYVEDLPNSDVIVEGYSRYEGAQYVGEELWQELTARMWADDPPRREE